MTILFYQEKSSIMITMRLMEQDQYDCKNLEFIEKEELAKYLYLKNHKCQLTLK